MFISVIIVVILLLCIKTIMGINVVPCEIGTFGNESYVDISGLRENFGLTILSGNSDSQTPFQFTVGSDINDENTESGIGNFQGQRSSSLCERQESNAENTNIRDFRYLEYVMNDRKWSDVCMNMACSGTVVGKSCDINSPNPGTGYKRTFGDSPLNYDDNMNDTQFKNIQYKDATIFVPWSDLYNNIIPANPTIR